MQTEHTIIIGAGPCGLSVGLELQKLGIEPLIIEKGNVVDAIYNYPTHQTFFSSSEKLEIGGVPFITEKKKPVRLDAMTYYRTVAERSQLRINSFEKVTNVENTGEAFLVSSTKEEGSKVQYEAMHVVVATGYYNQPNWMRVEGENLPNVFHYFKEGHPFFRKNVTVIGGKNSAVDATLELHKAGANITVLYRGDQYSSSIKPWILPEFDSLVRHEKVKMEFSAHVLEITPNTIRYEVNGVEKEIENDYVFAMTGYRPDLEFLGKLGIGIDPQTGIPAYDETTMETNIPDMYVAGVVVAGYNNNKVFIENGRFHGGLIAQSIKEAGKKL
ncbi:YpdA family putative bacillithiol disulfide reductase [Radiobacillus kanasensis]|uniref:YpdA family putative bacillithiol disulfide reductase n=1 Tax=Radiobacillus kanasensis TaxID=2844358 RepID=UPI001E3C278D|nr:YpdA family putative bacillithiol disulfide reductase [Radiobacillus kanasensis]UFT97646.1 YpdA family putative bacillithiol disulfide reductase [Radiobacillus kanasensis]